MTDIIRSPGDDEAFDVLEQELATLLRRARAISAEMGRDVHPDLDPEAYGLLSGIHDYSRARASELAGHFGLGKATVSRQLRVLAELGLIEREPDPADGRAYVLVITDEGRRRMESTRRARRRRWHAVLGRWPTDDVRLLADMLARFNRLGDDTCAAPHVTDIPDDPQGDPSVPCPPGHRA